MPWIACRCELIAPHLSLVISKFSQRPVEIGHSIQKILIGDAEVVVHREVARVEKAFPPLKVLYEAKLSGCFSLSVVELSILHGAFLEIRLVGRSTQRASLLQIEDRVLSRLRMTCQRLIYL